MCQDPGRGGGLCQTELLEVFHCVSARIIQVDVSLNESMVKAICHLASCCSLCGDLQESLDEHERYHRPKHYDISIPITTIFATFLQGHYPIRTDLHQITILP
jgi:hypothetical protein